MPGQKRLQVNRLGLKQNYWQDKQTLVFIHTWAYSIILQIWSDQEQVCPNVWSMSVSLHDISHEIVIIPTTVSASPTQVSLSYINNFRTFKQKLE